jgi:thiol-disulfide isomerase/thioredoxin
MNAGFGSRRKAVASVITAAVLFTAAASNLREMGANAAGTGAAPDLQLTDAAGNRHNLSHYHGRVVLVNFWTSWCPPCIHEMPALERLARRMADRSFAVLMVNVQEAPGILSRFTRLAEAGIVVLRDADGDTARRWGVGSYPTSFVLDAEGRIRAKVLGEEEWDSHDWLSRFEALLAENPPKTTVARK